jgi:exopolysaccharide biosynthesis polyprenyl glycosylphosphotransferase
MFLRYKEKLFFTVISDLAAMLIGFTIALALGHRSPMALSLFLFYRWGILTLIIFTLIIFFILDVYALYKMPERFLHQAVIIGLGLVLSAGLTTFTFFFGRQAVPRAVFILFYLFSFILIVSFRYVISKRTLSLIYWRALLVGDRERSVEVARLIKSRRYLHSEVVGYLSYEPGVQPENEMPYLGNVRDLLRIVENRGVNQIIVTVSKIDDELMGLLLESMKKKVKVSDFKKVVEEITGRVPMDHLSDHWFILALSTIDKRYFWYVKRFVDITTALLGLCFAAPLFPILAIMIKMDSPGPVFYRQARMGRRNRPFRVWKLRTMIKDADKDYVLWTTENDGRITRIGRYLRKVRLDEVPQLFNVLKGDMSLIGPRPEATSLVEMYKMEIPYYLERHMVTPGMTGWAQINYGYGNSIEDTRQKLMFDFYYIKNRSWVLDSMIFLRTIRTVLTGKGAI